MTRDIATVFQNAQQDGRVVLVGYLPAAFPDPKRYLEIVAAAASAGLDILEIGLPVKNPYLDGSVIRAALQTIGQQRITPDQALEIGAEAVQAAEIVGLPMLYPQTLLEIGTQWLFEQCNSLNLPAVLLAGASMVEWIKFALLAQARHIQPIGFIRANADIATIKSIVNYSQGFLYIQSYEGKTGERASFGKELEEHLARVRQFARPFGQPLVVGFGVQHVEDVGRLLAMGADGVVIGTALVKAASQGSQAVYQLVSQLASATVIRS